MPRLPDFAAAVAVVLLSVWCTPSAAAAKKTFVYLHDRGPVDRVYAFKYSKSGNLKRVKGAPFLGPDVGGDCGGLCQTLAWSGQRKMLVSGGPGGITVYKVSTTGALKVVAGSPFAVDTTGFHGTVALKVDGKTFVYAAEYDQDRVRGFTLKQNGKLAEMASSPTAVGSGPDGMDGAQGRLVVCNEDDLTLSSLLVGADGALSAAPPIHSGGGFVYNVRVAPGAAFAYQGDADGCVRGFGIDPDTAVLTPLVGNPVDSLLPEANAGVAVSDTFLAAFAFAVEDLNIAMLPRLPDGSLGAPALTATGLTGVSAHAFDAKGENLFVASDKDDLVLAYAVDPDTGALTLQASEAIPAAAQVNAIVCIRR